MCDIELTKVIKFVKVNYDAALIVWLEFHINSHAILNTLVIFKYFCWEKTFFLFLFKMMKKNNSDNET